MLDGSRARDLARSLGLAVGSWAVLAFLGWWARHRLADDALGAGAQTLPLALGLTLLVACVALVTWRGAGPRTVPLVLGLAGGWVSFTVLVVLSGTPYGIGGPVGDCGRTVAAAQRFTTTWHSADGLMKDLPSQYPPLWFWLWGRLAALRGVSAWQVMAVYQGLGLGFVVVLAGLAWRLVTHSWGRVLAAGLGTVAWVYAGSLSDPCKGHESTAFLLAAPLLLSASLTVGRVAAGRLLLGRALAWGVGVGVLFVLYQLPMLFSAPWLVALWLAWAVRRGAVRQVLAHLAVAGAGTLLASAWYVLPFLHAALTRNPGARPADLLMVGFTLQTSPGVPTTLGLTTAVPVVLGLLLTVRRVRSGSAQTVLALAGGAFAVQVLSLWNVALGGETFYSYKAVTWIGVVLVGAVALYLDPRELRAGGLQQVRLTAAGLALALAPATAYTWWRHVHATIVPVESLVPGVQPTLTDRAYRQLLPSCRPVPGLPAGSGDTAPCFPATTVASCVEQERGHELPVVLSYDDRPSAFYGYYQVLPSNSGAVGPLDDWTRRLAWVQGLTALSDPASFADQAEHGQYGPVDAFVLLAQPDGALRFRVLRYYGKQNLDFSRSQFPSTTWRVCEHGTTFVAVRRAAG